MKIKTLTVLVFAIILGITPAAFSQSPTPAPAASPVIVPIAIPTPLPSPTPLPVSVSGIVNTPPVIIPAATWQALIQGKVTIGQVIALPAGVTAAQIKDFHGTIISTGPNAGGVLLRLSYVAQLENK